MRSELFKNLRLGDAITYLEAVQEGALTKEADRRIMAELAQARIDKGDDLPRGFHDLAAEFA